MTDGTSSTSAAAGTPRLGASDTPVAANRGATSRSSSTPPTPRFIARSSGWGSADIARAAAIIIAVVAAAVGLWAASTIVLTVFLGVLFALAISSGVDMLVRLRIPRGLGALIVVLGVAGVVALLGALIAPTVGVQAREIQSRLPEALQAAEAWVARQERTTLRSITGHIPLISAPRDPGPSNRDTPVSQQAPTGGGATAPNMATQVTSGLAGIVSRLFGFVGSTVEIVVYILLVLFLAVYIASDPELYRRGVMHLFPHHARARAGEVLIHIASVLRQWLLTQLIAMITLGVVWAIVLSILDVKAALALAVIAGTLEFVPTIGPTMAVVPALAMGLLDSPGKALSVLGAYLLIQGLESNVLIPLLMQGRMDLPPALTIVAQALMTLAFGFLGLMVAVPVLAAVMVPIKMLYVRDIVGDPVSVGDEAEAPAG